MRHKKRPYSWRSLWNRPVRAGHVHGLHGRKPITLIFLDVTLKTPSDMRHIQERGIYSNGPLYLEESDLLKSMETPATNVQSRFCEFDCIAVPLSGMTPNCFASVQFHLFVPHRSTGIDMTGVPSVLSGPEPVGLSSTGREGCRETGRQMSGEDCNLTSIIWALVVSQVAKGRISIQSKCENRWHLQHCSFSL